MPDGGTTIIIQGKKRFEFLHMISEDPFFVAQIKLLEDKAVENDPDFDAYISTIKDLATEIIKLSPNVPTEAFTILKNIENPSFLINFVSSNLNTSITEKQDLLTLESIKLRAERLTAFLYKELQFAELKNKVTSKTRLEIDKQQRDYFLQQQLKSIKEELGGDPNEREIADMKK
jgi:ATP-dependent Lon protease